ncbi:hypothetical protein J6TS1_32990 [Siminovitchia terrae]|uniref:Uncharacterized protein n=1 Tax=Siminovitchia terrae TaxID=1914933 RepID=A0ABQ4KZM5_SIMTE|nr:hypothetical protein J6TS1_32990 [Siminovitchia terrae]
MKLNWHLFEIKLVKEASLIIGGANCSTLLSDYRKHYDSVLWIDKNKTYVYI